MNLLTLCACACAAVSTLTAGVGCLALAQVDAARKAEPTALMCFDNAGRPTLGADWRECRRVAYRVTR